jgi:hypothetical protein
MAKQQQELNDFGAYACQIGVGPAFLRPFMQKTLTIHSQAAQYPDGRQTSSHGQRVRPPWLGEK